MDKSRLLLQKSKRAIENKIRAQLLEFGFAISKSDKKLNEAVLLILGDAENELTGHFRFTLYTMWKYFLEIAGNLDETIKRCTQATNEDEECLRLQMLEGISPIGAMGLRIALMTLNTLTVVEKLQLVWGQRQYNIVQEGKLILVRYQKHLFIKICVLFYIKALVQSLIK